MSDEEPLSQTAKTSRSDPDPLRVTREWFLIRALDCDAPIGGSARHALRDVATVELERGTEHAHLRDNGVRALRLALPDRKLSSRHARLTRSGQVWLLEDLDSTNGTWVDGTRIARAELRDGSVFTVGHTVFLLRHASVERHVLPDLVLTPGGDPALATLNPALEDAMQRLSRMSPSQLPMLLLGESGTGKEVVARAVHRLSARPGPFVPVNCGAIPATLVESQLFGHVKGAFTGADRNENGFVRSATYGTLFLDEIGDLPGVSQAALLRVLQSGEVTPLGSSRPVNVDVRVIAATHKNVDELMESGAFRQDLYARLAGFVDTLPPVRERREDLGLLIGTLLVRHAADAAAQVRIRPEAARALFAYDWRLNVRELEQCLAAALVMADSSPIGLEHLPLSVRRPQKPPREAASTPTADPPTARQRELHDALVAALRETKGNVSEAARRMGKARQLVQRWIRRFGIEPSSFH